MDRWPVWTQWMVFGVAVIIVTIFAIDTAIDLYKRNRSWRRTRKLRKSLKEEGKH